MKCKKIATFTLSALMLVSSFVPSFAANQPVQLNPINIGQEVEPNNIPAEGNLWNYNSSNQVMGRINFNGDQDNYNFVATSSGKHTLTYMIPQSGATFYLFDITASEYLVYFQPNKSSFVQKSVELIKGHVYSAMVYSDKAYSADDESYLINIAKN